MKIAHLASFRGNVGDVINHKGLYTGLKKHVASELTVTPIEIRDFYKSNRLRHFDEDFVQLINEHDLFIIGGGNFFELCWDYSSTGTTIDIAPEILSAIQTPILINAIGVDDLKGVTTENAEKFERFIAALISKNAFITVRNDGSYEIIQKYLSQELVEHIQEIPDTAFMIATLNRQPVTKTAIGFNIVKDMQEIRFKHVNYEEWLKSLRARVVYLLAHTPHDIVFFPHILSDYEIILELISTLESKYSRQRVSIAGLIQGNELKVLEEYRACHFVFASRFHSNISCIALGIPSFGTVSYEKHGILFDKLHLQHRKCFIDAPDFFEQLDHQIELIVANDERLEEIATDYQQCSAKLVATLDDYFSRVGSWLNQKDRD